jgi:hypothetical protein
MKKILINIFIVMNLMMMLRAQLDAQAPVINFVYKPVTFVQNYLSMWRGWNMFSPNPLRTNQYIDAKIVYKDGNREIWDFPRPSSNDLFARYMWGERFRKYTSDALRLDTKSFLWEDGAKFVLKKIMEEPNAILPEKIILRRRWLPIPKWDKKFIPHREAPKEHYNVFEYYTYEVGQQ